MTASPKKQLHFLTETGKKVLLDDAMIALRDGIARGLGYTLGPCSFAKCYPKKPARDFLCWERGSYTQKIEDTDEEVQCGSYHCVSGINNARMEKDGERLWPDEVMKAARAIDRNKRAKAIDKVLV